MKGKIPLPDVTEIEYLLDWAKQLRFVSRPSNGYMVPLPYAEVKAFFELIGVCPEPWEAVAIMKMSVAYVRGYGLGLDEFSFSPMELQHVRS